MKGLSHTYYQIYAYQNLDFANKLLNLDGYKNYDRDDKKQLIIYKFPLNKCIRLDFLLKSLKLIRIHLAQLLLIIKDILIHIKKLENNHISNPNLQTNKIWIVLDDGSEQFNIDFSKLSYKIHFVGYQMNDINETISPDEYQNVIKEILNCMGNIKLDDKKSKLFDNQILQIDPKLVQPLFTDILNIIDKLYEQAIDQINQILQNKQYKYDQKLQLFKDIDQDFTSFKRSRKEICIVEYLEALHKLNQQEFIKMEQQNKEITSFTNLQIYQIQNLSFEDRFYKALNDLEKNLKNTFWDKDIKYPNGFDTKLLENMKVKFIADLSTYSSHLINSLDKLQEQELKFKSNIPENDVLALVIKYVDQYLCYYLNSLEIMSQLFNDNNYKWILDKLKKNMKSEILQIHKEKFIQKAEQLIQNLI